MRYLDRDDLRRALTMPDAIDAMRAAYGPDRETPQRMLLGSSFFMPGRVGATAGIKVVSIVPGDPVGIVAVFDADGTPIGLVDGPTLTAIRTAAGCGLATELLAAADASTMAMLGAGAMAADQIEAVRAVRPIERVLVWSRTRQRAEALADRVGGVAVDDPDSAVAEADIVTTATPSTSPLIGAASVRPGSHVNAVGAFTPDMVELPVELVQRAWVVVDDRDAAAVEAGDLLQAGVAPDADMAEVMGGARPPSGAVTVFKSVGIASQDVAAAHAALAAAAARGIGVAI